MPKESQKNASVDAPGSRRDVLKALTSAGLILSSLPISSLVARLAKRGAEFLSHRSPVASSELPQDILARSAQITIDPETQEYEYPLANVEFTAAGEKSLHVSFGNHGKLAKDAIPLKIPEGVRSFMPDTLPSIFLLTDYSKDYTVEFVDEERNITVTCSTQVSSLPEEVRRKLIFILEQYRQWIPFTSQDFELVAVDELPISEGLFALYLMVMDSDPESYLRMGTFGVLSKLGVLGSLAMMNKTTVELAKKLVPGMPESRREFLMKLPLRAAMLGVAASALPDIANSTASSAKLLLIENYMRGYPIADKVTVPDKLRFFHQTLDQSETLSPEMRAHMWRDLVSVYKIVYTHQQDSEQPHMAAWGNLHSNQLGLYALKANEILKFIGLFLDKHADEVKSWYPTQVHSICTTTTYQITDLDQVLAGKSDIPIDIRVLPFLYKLLVKHGFFPDKK